MRDGPGGALAARGHWLGSFSPPPTHQASGDPPSRWRVDPRLEAHGVTIFAGYVDFERERLVVEVAAADPADAREVMRSLYGDPVEVEVVAPAPYIVEAVPWGRVPRGATKPSWSYGFSTQRTAAI